MPSSGVQTCALDRKSTRLNSSHGSISYDVFCLKKASEGLGLRTIPDVHVDLAALDLAPGRQHRVEALIRRGDASPPNHRADWQDAGVGGRDPSPDGHA